MRCKELIVCCVLYCLCSDTFGQTLLREPLDDELAVDGNSSYAVNGTTNTTRWSPWYQESVVYEGQISVQFLTIALSF